MGIIHNGHTLSLIQHYYKLKNKPLEGNIEGICFGFSLCICIFAHLGKLQWWFEILTLISSWEKSLESLSKRHCLSNGDEYDLDHLFNMAGDFLLRHEVIDLNATEFQAIDNPMQRELLTPGSSLKVMTGDASYSIKDNFTIVLRGSDDFELFINAFRETYPNNEVMCLIYNENHTYSLICQDNNAYLFDPRGVDTDIKYRLVRRVIETFDNFADHFEELEDIVIGIDLISFSEPIDPKITKLGVELIDRVCKNYNAAGLRQIAKFIPDLIEPILKNIESGSFSEQVALVKLLPRRGWILWPNTFQILIAYAPESTPVLIKLISCNPDFYPFIVETFDGYFNTPQILLRYASQYISEFFTMVSAVEILHEPCAKSLLEINDGVDFLSLLIIKAPWLLPTFINLMSSTEFFHQAYESMMLQAMHSKSYPLHFLATYHPEHFYTFLQSLELSKNLVEIFSKLLKVEDDKGWPLFHRILANGGNSINLLAWLAKSHKSIMLTIHDLWPIEINDNKVTATALMLKHDYQTQNLWKGLFSLTVYVKNYSLFGEFQEPTFKGAQGLIIN